MDWALFDEEGAMRQRYADIDDRTEAVKDAIRRNGWSWEDFQEMYDISWIYHENGLEGVVLTYPEIKSAVDNKIISDVSLMPRYRDIKNQKYCIDLMREKASNRRFNLSINFLKEMHGTLVGDPELAGVYRKDIPIHRTYFHEIAHPQKIHDDLAEVLDELKSKEARSLHPIELAAVVHHRFMRVFPFSQYSGMIGRLITNFVLARHEYLPAVIHATDRQRYYEALRSGERNFRSFLVETMENSLDNALRFFGAPGNQAQPRGGRRAQA